MKKIMILILGVFWVICSVQASPVVIPAHLCLKSTPVTMLDKIAQLAKGRVNGKDVVCPDGKSLCQNGQTCCTNSTGEYNCCPLAHAVCCSDHIHCCVAGSRCQVDPTGVKCVLNQ
jgi:hypothetical protein